MNKDGKKERNTSKGQETRKSTKVNKPKWNEKKTPAGEKAEQADDDVSKKFPNFSVLNEEERSAFFEALTAARKNVQKRGGPVRERFGTVHDAYLQYFKREEEKENDERPLASDPSPVLDAGNPPKTVDDKPRKSEIPLNIRGKLAVLEHCESVIEEDTNKILGLYKKKKKNDKARIKKTEVPKTPKTQTKRIEGKPKEKNETVLTCKVSEVSVSLSNTPRFDALNVAEKEVFFKTLQEARNNIVKKNPTRKKEILPMDSIMRRYGDDVGIKSVFTAKQEPLKYDQGKANLKVKLTLTSGDNDRLIETIREREPEEIPRTQDVRKSRPETKRRLDAEDFSVVDISQAEIQHPKREESKHEIKKIASSKLNWATMKKSVSEESPRTPETQSSETSQKSKARKPKKTATTGKKTKTLSSEVSMNMREDSSTRFRKPGKKKSRGAATKEEKSSEKRKQGRKANSMAVSSIETNTSKYERIGREENEEVKTETSSPTQEDSFGREETREEQTDDKFPNSCENLAPSSSKMESQRTICEAACCQDCQEEAKEPPNENKPEEQEECSSNSLSESQEHLGSRSFTSVKREERKLEIPTLKDERVEREEEPSEECREEESQRSQNVCQDSAKPSAATKVMIVDDGVIDKIRNLIYYLEAKAAPGGSLETEYIKLIVDYIDYLSKVLESLVLEKKSEQSRNEIVAAQVHLKFDEAKRETPEGRKFVPRSVSEQAFAKGHYQPQHQEEKKKKDEKTKEKESNNDDFMFNSDSDSSLESDTEIHYVPPAPAKKQVATTKIRLLQDLIKKRAEFVRSNEDFKIVYHPQEEFVPEPKPKTVKIIREEEDSPIESHGMKLLNALLRFCRCGKKKMEDEGVFENLKGEAVRVDVTEDKRDAANATLNRSILEVLKASARKKIIEKYYSKE